MKGKPACATTSESRAAQLQLSASEENSLLLRIEQVLARLPPLPATLDCKSAKSKYVRVLPPIEYRRRLAEIAALVLAREGRLGPRAQKNVDPNQFSLISWIVGWDPRRSLCIAPEMLGNRLVADIQKSVGCGATTELGEDIKGSLAQVRVDAKGRLELPGLLARGVNVTNDVTFSRRRWWIELWGSDQFAKMCFHVLEEVNPAFSQK